MHAADPAKVNAVLGEFAKSAVDNYGARAVYLFGSLIYRGGAQFIDSSDVDLVVVLPDLSHAIGRWRWLQLFSEWVSGLEVKLMRVLHRTGSEPSVSVVAVTEAELVCDVHKDGHREFFTANVFRDLVTAAEAEGIPGAGVRSTDRFVAGALSFTQKARNDFLAVSANDTPRMTEFLGPDPLPKRVMRAAAMASRASGRTGGAGAEHDVQEGLDLLSNELYARRDDDPAYRQLQDLVSVRRHARGTPRPVEPAQQLLLAEMIYDIASGASRLGSATGGGAGPAPADHPPSEAGAGVANANAASAGDASPAQ
ncbi:MAG TPA: hypothetical protein VF614_01695, partial [Chthoniobacteraceae bacterium]